MGYTPFSDTPIWEASGHTWTTQLSTTSILVIPEGDTSPERGWEWTTPLPCYPAPHFKSFPRWDSQVSVHSNPSAESTPGRCMPWRSWMCATLRMRLSRTFGGMRWAPSRLGSFLQQLSLEVVDIFSWGMDPGMEEVVSSFFGGLFGLKWHFSEHVPIWSMWNVLPRPLRIRGWTQKFWGAAGDILGWPLSHLAIAREARSEARLLSEVSGHPNVVALPLGRWSYVCYGCYGMVIKNCPRFKGISMLVLAPAWQDVTKCCLLLWYACFVRLAESLIIQAKPMLLVRSRFLLQPRHETYLESPGLYYMIMERPLSSWMDNAIKGVK